MGDPTKPVEEMKAKSSKTSSKSSEVRQRVMTEMRHRNGPCGCLPGNLRDQVFEPNEAMETIPHIEAELRHSFAVLANILANQAFAFADTTMAALCRRHIDEAMSSIALSPEQERAVASRHGELS